jgi:hypothetical protein
MTHQQQIDRLCCCVALLIRRRSEAVGQAGAVSRVLPGSEGQEVQPLAGADAAPAPSLEHARESPLSQVERVPP